MNGFRGYSHKYLLHPGVEPLRACFVHFNVQMYLSLRAPALNLRVVEIPVSRVYPDDGSVPTKVTGFIRQFKVDIGLIGISGIEADGTMRDFDYREVKVAKAIIEHSRQVWLAADHTKFNRPAMVKLAPMSDIDCVFTDAHPTATFVEMMEQAGVECIVAT